MRLWNILKEGASYAWWQCGFSKYKRHGLNCCILKLFNLRIHFHTGGKEYGVRIKPKVRIIAIKLIFMGRCHYLV